MRTEALFCIHYLNNFFLHRIVNFFLPTLNLEKYKNHWEIDSVANEYSSKSLLFKPEETILEILKLKLPYMKMLDVGVGAGRTTTHFAPLVQKYVGIDYSAKMITACKNKFKENKEWLFNIADVKNLDSFADDEFDFVLFSFNGLDCMSGTYNDRQEALKEIRRVLKKDGYFFLSAHNLNYIWRFCKFASLDIHEIRRMLVMRLCNRKSWKNLRIQNKTFASMNINVLDGSSIVPIFIVSPKMQITMLHELGFKDLQVFDLEGKPVELSTAERDDTNYSLYYLSKPS